MATYPETNPTPIYPLIIKTEYKTIIRPLDGDAAAEERQKKWVFPKYDVTVRYGSLIAAEVFTLENFHSARFGAHESFYIYALDHLAGVTKACTTKFCGVANGVDSIYDLPGRSTSAQTVYADNVEDTQASILTGGGASSSDRIQFASAPTAGTVITADFTGIFRMHVRFAHDVFSRVLHMRNRYQNQQVVELVGVAPV